MYRNAILLLLFCAIFLVAPSAASAVTIDTVAVGNVGNGNDPWTGNHYGGVSYAYRIGTTEVTVGQYTAFLNAVGATDPFWLYNTSMATNVDIAGIARSGASGNYSYSVIGSANKPVTYVSWGDAARFSNWLHNGQPAGPQNTSTTENGTYNLNGAVTPGVLASISRKAGGTWFIPTENEWYKAAYHQPTAQGGDADNYWLYPTRSNSTSYSDQPPGGDAPTPSNTGNFYRHDGLANGYNDGNAASGSPFLGGNNQNLLTDAGAYTSATSPYGTFDQGGNVWEWNETFGLRGGSWFFDASYLESLMRNHETPTNENYLIGFRVATVPEPSSFVLAALGLICLVVFRRPTR